MILLNQLANSASGDEDTGVKDVSNCGELGESCVFTLMHYFYIVCELKHVSLENVLILS